MFRAASQRVDLFRVIVLHFALVAQSGCASADTGSCHEVKTAYMMRQIGPVELVPETPGTGESLRVCVHPGPTCCTSKMEDSYMAAVRSETQQKMQSYSFELKYLIAGHTKAYQDTFESLVSFTSNLTSSLFDSAYSSLASDCRPLVFQLFGDIKRHLSGDSTAPLDNSVRRFYNDLFPLVYRRLLNPGIGDMSLQSSTSNTLDDCLRLTRQDVSPFGSHPRLLVSSLSSVLGVGRALSRLLRLASEVVNATEKATLSRECGRGLVRMQYCSHCRGLTLIRPCTGLCVNIMRGCLVGLSELGTPWRSLVVLLQRLAATLATSSNHNSMELALLAVRNHVNDAILHAQLHGPRITATVEKVCGPQDAGPMITRTKPTGSHNATSVAAVASLTSEGSSMTPPAHQRLQLQSQRLFPLKGSRGDKSRNLKKMSREFEGSIQRYQWFFTELPEMLCESEMEVEQHTCWSGRDVAESYPGHVVGSTLKAQRENPEVTVRNTDPVLKRTKQKLEQLTQELLVELGWARKARVRVEEEEGGSTQTDRGSGSDCDDEDGCEASGGEMGEETDDSSSGQSPDTKNVAQAPLPHHPVPPHHPSTPQVVVRGSAHTVTFKPLPLTAVTLLLLLLLSMWDH
ncbi:glypican-5-like isoform X1 [Solea senegalensis]|uniref:Glypican-5-like isoform X1 n=1 Tax=Solea senegalensis TaxID=28829 RepID=A0AAV6SBU0_SOLSE|nr:glypican-5-like [Solea senegalensis]KAG7514729.1 glypican-5-like isoform X1 [Solea senegalensis]